MGYVYDPLLGSNLVPVTSVSGAVIGPGSSTNGDIAIWNGTSGTMLSDSGFAFPIPPQGGGTGVANSSSSTITISGNFPSIFTLTASTGVTFPTSGTLATTSQLPTFPISPSNGGTGISNNNASTLTISGSFPSTFTLTGITSVTFPTSGTLATTSQLPSLPLSVLNGGTGDSTFANISSLICTGTSPTGSLQNVASAATGQVLISAGTSTLPSYSAFPQISGLGIGASPGSTAGLTFDGSNFLTSYATGTFSPAFSLATPGTSSFTYTSQIGRYTKIGSWVDVMIHVNLSAYAVGTGSGNFQIGSLPFTSSSVTNQDDALSILIDNMTLTGFLWMCARIVTNSTMLLVIGCASGSASNSLSSSAPSNTTKTVIGGGYSTV